MALRTPFRWTLVALLAALPTILPSEEAGAICPSKAKGPGGAVPPGLREPFDPPPDGETPPDPPEDAPPPPPGGGGPVTPPSTPPPAITPPGKAPDAPTMPGPGGPTTPRSRPARGLETLDDASWELWWGLNRADVLPRVKRQADVADGTYARTLPPELRPAIDVLLAALDDGDTFVRQAAAGAFAGFRTDYRGRETLEALRRITQGGDHWLRDLCHLGLGLRGDHESMEGMRQVLRSRGEAPVSRAFAGLALVQLGDPKGMAEVEKAVADLEETDIAGSILIGLGASKNAAHLPLLMEAAQRRGGSAVRLRRVRADALAALGKLGDPSSVAYLGGLLDDREKVIARSAALALGGFRESSAAAQLLKERALASEDPFVRAFGALSLGRIGLQGSLPTLARQLVEDKEPAVRPFVQLAVGLLRDPGGAVLLGESLGEDPRSGRFSTAALASGLMAHGEARPQLEPSLNDMRTASAPACGALGLALMGAKDLQPRLRERYWFDSARARPGFDQALALLDAASQSTWLLGELSQARRSSMRRVLVDGLGLCGGPAEGAALATRYQATPKGDIELRVRILEALASVINDRAVSKPRSLLLHTYYLQPNDVLGHLAFLP